MSETDYRDPIEGARARRTDLLRRRRDDLATMPHAVRRVVVARRARIAGAAAMLAVGVTFAIAAAVPAVEAALARVLPGDDPAVLATLVFAAWLAGIVAFWIARSSAEHRFAVAMSRHVLPGADLDHDLQRLDHERPDEAARALGHRLEVASAALPVAATAYVVPATAAYAALAIAARGWPHDNTFDRWLHAHGAGLATVGFVGLVAAVATTHRAARAPGVARFAALAAATFGALALVDWWLVGPAAIAMTLAGVVVGLRRERAQIRAEDPAAGSEIFTIRGALRRARAVLGAVRAVIARRRALTIAVKLAVVPAIVAAIVAVGERRAPPLVAEAPAVPIVRPAAPPATPRLDVAPTVSSKSTFAIEPCERGQDCFEVTLVIRDGERVDVPLFPNVAYVPDGWRAELVVRYAMIDPAGARVAVAFACDSGDLGDVDASVRLDSSRCANTTPSTVVTFHGPPTGDHVVRLVAWPRLYLAASPNARR